jgi:hypothetical protein
MVLFRKISMFDFQISHDFLQLDDCVKNHQKWYPRTFVPLGNGLYRFCYSTIGLPNLVVTHTMGLS